MTDKEFIRFGDNSYDISLDGELLVSIRPDDGRLTSLVKEAGAAAIGTLRIYSLESFTMLREDRMNLSQSSVDGSGLTREEGQFCNRLMAISSPKEPEILG